jgi:hypothetical protein
MPRSAEERQAALAAVPPTIHLSFRHRAFSPGRQMYCGCNHNTAKNRTQYTRCKETKQNESLYLGDLIREAPHHIAVWLLGSSPMSACCWPLGVPYPTCFETRCSASAWLRWL